jgi:hypothetical protein
MYRGPPRRRRPRAHGCIGRSLRRRTPEMPVCARGEPDVPTEGPLSAGGPAIRAAGSTLFMPALRYGVASGSQWHRTPAGAAPSRARKRPRAASRQRCRGPVRRATDTDRRLRTCGERGGAAGSRTPDLFDANEARYQLRYSPKCVNQPSRSARAEAQSLTAQRRSRISSSSVGTSSMTVRAISSVESES